MDEGETKFRDVIIKDFEAKQSLIEEVRKFYLGQQLRNIFQRGALLKQFLLLSAGVLTLTPLIFEKPGILQGYFLWGVFGHILNILLILSYLRETLDRDAWKLQKDLDEYNKIFEEQKSIFRKALASPPFTLQSLQKYFQDIESSEGTKQLKSHLEESEKRKERRRKSPDYATNLLIFIFIVSSLLLLASVLLPLFDISYLKPWKLVGLIVIIFWLTMSDFVLPLFEYLSKIPNFLAKRRLFILDESSKPKE